MKESFFLETEHGRVFCRQWGGGDTLLIALHGFGDQSNVFDWLDPSISQNRRIIAIDLPFHGQTVWNKPDCAKEDIMQIIQTLLAKAQKSCCILLGFSLGGRIALSLWPDMREKIAGIILLAPDGIRTNGLVWPEAIPVFFRKLIRRVMLASSKSTHIIKWISNKTWLPETSQRFARKHLISSDKLGTTLSWWISLSAFSVSPVITLKMATPDPVPVQIWVGTRDPLISIRHIQAFWKDYPAVEIKEIKGKGHRVGFTNQ